MTNADFLPPTDRRLGALALTLAVHLLLVFGWQMARQVPQGGPDAPREAIEWRWIKPPAPAIPAPPKPRAVAAERAEPHPVSRPPEVISASPPAVITPDAQPAPAAAPPSADDMLQQAKRDVGKIDRDLRHESRAKGIKAPVVSAQTRLERGIEHAADMAPNRWYQAPKVKEIIDPGGYGRRRYRVVGANGIYCVTYESNHAPDGLDSMKNGIVPKRTNCEEHEQPATTQKW